MVGKFTMAKYSNASQETALLLFQTLTVSPRNLSYASLTESRYDFFPRKMSKFSMPKNGIGLVPLIPWTSYSPTLAVDFLCQ